MEAGTSHNITNLQQGEPSTRFTELEMKWSVKDKEGLIYFWHLQGAADFSATVHKTDKRRDGKIRLNTPRQPTETTVLVRI